MENMSLTEIRNNIYLFSLIDILKTKRLTFDFVCKYILNPDFQITKEEEQIIKEERLDNKDQEENDDNLLQPLLPPFEGENLCIIT